MTVRENFLSIFPKLKCTNFTEMTKIRENWKFRQPHSPTVWENLLSIFSKLKCANFIEITKIPEKWIFLNFGSEIWGFSSMTIRDDLLWIFSKLKCANCIEIPEIPKKIEFFMVLGKKFEIFSEKHIPEQNPVWRVELWTIPRNKVWSVWIEYCA